MRTPAENQHKLFNQNFRKLTSLKLLNTLVNNANASKNAVSDGFTAGCWTQPHLCITQFFHLQTETTQLSQTTEIVYGPVRAALMTAHGRKYTVQKTKMMVIFDPQSQASNTVHKFILLLPQNSLDRLILHISPIFSLYFPFWYMRITKFDDYNAKRDVYQFSELFHQDKHTNYMCKLCI